MESAKRYIVQQTLINGMTENQMLFYNTILFAVDKTHNKLEKEI
jgi:hypothetical protein